LQAEMLTAAAAATPTIMAVRKNLEVIGGPLVEVKAPCPLGARPPE
jgi:hypothetical protein